MNSIPHSIHEKLLHFQREVIQNFEFLIDYGYTVSEKNIGRSQNFLHYYCDLSFKNDATTVSIGYNTDIINGHIEAFPDVKQMPVIDDLVSCSIFDSNAFMSVEQFAKKIKPDIPDEEFSITKFNSGNTCDEITRVVENYSNFFKNYLVEVLKKEKIFDCKIDRFYDEVYREIKYLHN